jgi:hypothetical protein
MKKSLSVLIIILIFVSVVTGNTCSYFTSSCKAETIVLSPTGEKNVIAVVMETDGNTFYEREPIVVDVLFEDAEQKGGLMDYEIETFITGSSGDVLTSTESPIIENDFCEVFSNTSSEAITIEDMDGMKEGIYSVVFKGEDLDGWTIYRSLVEIEIKPIPVVVESMTVEPMSAATSELIAEEPAGEEVPVEEPAAEEAATEETTESGTPVEEAAGEEAPVEEPATEETVTEETPAEEIPVEEAAGEEVPVEEPAAEEAVTEETTESGTPAEEAAGEEAPVEEPAAEEPATEETTESGTPVEEAAGEEALVEESAAEEPATDETIESGAPAEDATTEEDSDEPYRVLRVEVNDG